MILTKSNIYESRIIVLEKYSCKYIAESDEILRNSELRNNILYEYKQNTKFLYSRLCEFSKRALFLDNAVYYGSKILTDYFLDKCIKNDIFFSWNKLMCEAIGGDHINIMEYCISQGADDWSWAIFHTSCGSSLEKYIEKKIDKELENSHRKYEKLVLKI